MYPRANLITMTDDPRQNENRRDRDWERSDEAHWGVAEEGAEEQSERPNQETEKRQEETRTEER